MVSQSYLVAAKFLGLVIEGTTAHLGAEGARVWLFADVKDDALDVGLTDGVGHLQFPAQGFNFGKIHLLISHMQGDGVQFKGDGIKAAKLGQKPQ